jgi:KaiC/GvpD/RAD55 family RecA-like ATPase
MRSDGLEEGSKVKFIEFESGSLTGAPGFNEFGMDPSRRLDVSVALTILDDFLVSLSGKGKPEELDCAESLQAWPII